MSVDIDGAFGIRDRKRMLKSSCLVAQVCWEELCVFPGKKKGLGSAGGWDFGGVWWVEGITQSSACCMGEKDKNSPLEKSPMVQRWLQFFNYFTCPIPGLDCTAKN